jgi:hypothetical protein
MAIIADEQYLEKSGRLVGQLNDCKQHSSMSDRVFIKIPKEAETEREL